MSHVSLNPNDEIDFIQSKTCNLPTLGNIRLFEKSYQLV